MVKRTFSNLEKEKALTLAMQISRHRNANQVDESTGVSVCLRQKRAAELKPILE